MGKLSKLGEVSSVAGALAIVLAREADARTWGGARNDDYEAACGLLGEETTGAGITWADGAGEGVLTGMGRAGSADVFRIAMDELLIAPLVVASDWSKATELAYLEDLGALPAKASTAVGRIVVSDVLAVVSGAERATITDQAVATARSNGSCKRRWGLLAALTAGTYDIVYETMNVDASWGLLDCRLRIVPEGRLPAVLARKATRPQSASPRRSSTAPRQVLELEAGANRVASIAFSPDGTSVAAGAVGSSSAALWGIPSFARIATYEGIGPSARDFSKTPFWMSVRLCFVGNGDRVALAVGERVEIRELGGAVLHRGILVSCDAAERKGRRQTLPPLPLAERRMSIESLAYDPAGPFLVLGGAHFHVSALSDGPTEVTELVQANVPTITATHHVRSPRGTRLITSYPPMIVARANAFDAEPTGIALLLSNASFFAWSPDERFVALIEDYRARTVIFDSATAEKIATIKSPSSRVEAHCLAFRPDGTQLALGDSDGTVRVYDTASWKRVAELPDHDTRSTGTDARSIDALAWSPDGTWLAVGNGLRGAPGALSLYASADLR